MKVRIQARLIRSKHYAFTSNDFKGLVEYVLRVLVKEGESLKEVGGVFAFLGLIRFDNSPLSARSGCYLHHGLGSDVVELSNSK